MEPQELARWIRLAGIGHLLMLIPAALVPRRLNWRAELTGLSRLHRQMHWVYGGYVVLAIFGFGLISVLMADELAQGSMLARAVCAYLAAFWGGRLALQFVFDVEPYLRGRWTMLGYHSLSLLFAALALVYTLGAVLPRG